MVCSKNHSDLIQFSILIPPHAKSLWSEGVCVLLWTIEELGYNHGKNEKMEFEL
mgnify:CR=1 FL=1